MGDSRRMLTLFRFVLAVPVIGLIGELQSGMEYRTVHAYLLQLGGVRTRGREGGRGDATCTLVTYLRSALTCTRVSDPSSSQRFHFRPESSVGSLCSPSPSPSSPSQPSRCPTTRLPRGRRGSCFLLTNGGRDAKDSECATLEGGGGRYYINTWWRISGRRVLDRVLERRMEKTTVTRTDGDCETRAAPERELFTSLLSLLSRVFTILFSDVRGGRREKNRGTANLARHCSGAHKRTRPPCSAARKRLK